MRIRRKAVAMLVGAMCFALAGSVEAGANRKVRRELERVAKGWCETIRASQVIPVYPLTEDLEPGDVFLVQTTLQDDAVLWKKKGFLPLNDHRVRLSGIDYKKLYFDGYWKDSFSAYPHQRAKRPNAGTLPAQTKPGTGSVGTNPGGGSAGIGLTDLDAPRAAFPSYTFSAKSGMGLGVALPIHGLATALSFLRSEAVSGTVTIADAHTYGADLSDLYHRLNDWTQSESVQEILSGAVDSQKGKPVLLRVVSRVYLAGGLVVSLTRSGSQGISARAGTGPAVSPVTAAGTVDTNYQEVLTVLDKAAAGTKEVDRGGSIKFVGASESSIGMAESFDRPLVIGYLGFDVPVGPGPTLGKPVPIWSHLEELAGVVVPRAIHDFSPQGRRYKVDEYMVESMSKEDPCRAAKVMSSVVKRLHAIAFSDSEKEIKQAEAALASVDCKSKGAAAAVKSALEAFKKNAITFVSTGGSESPNHDSFSAAVVSAWCETSSAGC